LENESHGMGHHEKWKHWKEMRGSFRLGYMNDYCSMSFKMNDGDRQGGSQVGKTVGDKVQFFLPLFLVVTG
jgi:hypothetical protein